jgi:hypothetical protein
MCEDFKSFLLYNTKKIADRDGGRKPLFHRGAGQRGTICFALPTTVNRSHRQ